MKVKNTIIRVLQVMLAGLVVGNFLLPFISVVFVPVLLIFIYQLIKCSFEEVFNQNHKS